MWVRCILTTMTSKMDLPLDLYVIFAEEKQFDA